MASVTESIRFGDCDAEPNTDDSVEQVHLPVLEVDQGTSQPVMVYADGLQILANTAEEQTTYGYVYDGSPCLDGEVVSDNNPLILVVQNDDSREEVVDGSEAAKLMKLESSESNNAVVNTDYEGAIEVDVAGSNGTIAALAHESGQGYAMYQCFKCEKLFQTQDECEAHIDQLHPDMHHMCPLCNTLMSHQDFLTHVDAQHFRCRLCPDTQLAIFNTQKKLELHTLKAHKTECYICHQKVLKQSLSEHMMTSHPLTCTLCYGLEMFQSEDELNNHLIKVHHSVCAFCRKFVLKKDLAAHIANEHHRCDQCYATFDTTDDLETHRTAHHIPRTSQSATPSTTTRTTTSTTRHLAGHTLSATRKRGHAAVETLRVAYYCTVCYMDFPTVEELKEHKETHRGGD